MPWHAGLSQDFPRAGVRVLIETNSAEPSKWARKPAKLDSTNSAMTISIAFRVAVAGRARCQISTAIPETAMRMSPAVSPLFDEVARLRVVPTMRRARQLKPNDRTRRPDQQHFLWATRADLGGAAKTLSVPCCTIFSHRDYPI